jgi:molybdopterin-guanine dinucleotide biosynthesis protein A
MPGGVTGRTMEPADFEAVILAGGGARRLRGADKPALEVGGTPLLVSVGRAAAAAGARRVVVVGPERSGAVADGLQLVGAGLPGGLVTVRESPAGGGPVAALRRGLAEVTASWLALLAADLPFLTGAWVAALLAQARGRAGAVLADGSGRPQWLAGCWRAEALRQTLARYDGESLRGLLAPMAPALVQPTEPALPPWLDCDDAESLAHAQALAARQDGEA